MADIDAWNQWKQKRANEAAGWLTVCGLYWLTEKGDHSIGSLSSDSVILPLSPSLSSSLSSNVGKLVTTGDSNTVLFYPSSSFISSPSYFSSPIQISGTTITSTNPVSLENDENGNQTIVKIGDDITFFIMKRSVGLGVRVKNKKSEKLETFKGLEYFDYDPQAKVTAKFIPHEKIIKVPNVLGAMMEYQSPGALEFSWKDSKICKLDPVVDSGKLWILFKDSTSTKQTYSMRFIYTEKANEKGEVEIDFNYAYSPACMFTSFAACPLPPQQNILSFPVSAGELKYDGLH